MMETAMLDVFPSFHSSITYSEHKNASRLRKVMKRLLNLLMKCSS